MVKELSQADVERLMRDPSPEARAETAGKIAGWAASGALAGSERQIALEIFRLMAKDAEQRVRAALSVELKDMADLEPEIAKTLATDGEDGVALPMLQFSEALSDADLIEIVSTQAPTRQSAVARRDTVSEAVSDAIVTHGDKDAVVALVGNPGAALSDSSFDRVIDRYGDDEDVQTPLVHRPALPVTVAERLVARVSAKLQEHLVTHHDLPATTATDLILQARERATVGLLSQGSDADAEALVAQLVENGRLTPSLILRALCVGDLRLFEAAMSTLAGVPLANARALIHDEGDLGFKSLYAKAGLPKGLLGAFRAALDVAREMEHDRSDDDLETVMKRNLERVLTMAEHPGETVGEENADYLLAKLGALGEESRKSE